VRCGKKWGGGIWEKLVRWAKLKKTRIKGEMWEKVGWRHLGEMGAVGEKENPEKQEYKVRCGKTWGGDIWEKWVGGRNSKKQE
jgi:hypothetical protein